MAKTELSSGKKPKKYTKSDVSIAKELGLSKALKRQKKINARRERLQLSEDDTIKFRFLVINLDDTPTQKGKGGELSWKLTLGDKTRLLHAHNASPAQAALKGAFRGWCNILVYSYEKKRITQYYGQREELDRQLNVAAGAGKLFSVRYSAQVHRTRVGAHYSKSKKPKFDTHTVTVQGKNVVRSKLALSESEQKLPTSMPGELDEEDKKMLWARKSEKAEMADKKHADTLERLRKRVEKIMEQEGIDKKAAIAKLRKQREARSAESKKRAEEIKKVAKAQGISYKEASKLMAKEKPNKSKGKPTKKKTKKQPKKTSTKKQKAPAKKAGAKRKKSSGKKQSTTKRAKK